MILDKIESAGLSLEITDAGKLCVTGRLNDDQRAYIRDHKKQLICALRLRHFKLVPHCVKCISCQHFVRSDHPHLGRCDAGVNQSALAGFWDTHLRGCNKFIESTQAANSLRSWQITPVGG